MRAPTGYWHAERCFWVKVFEVQLCGPLIQFNYEMCLWFWDRGREKCSNPRHAKNQTTKIWFCLSAAKRMRQSAEWRFYCLPPAVCADSMVTASQAHWPVMRLTRALPSSLSVLSRFFFFFLRLPFLLRLYSPHIFLSPPPWISALPFPDTFSILCFFFPPFPFTTGFFFFWIPAAHIVFPPSQSSTFSRWHFCQFLLPFSLPNPPSHVPASAASSCLFIRLFPQKPSFLSLSLPTPRRLSLRFFFFPSTTGSFCLLSWNTLPRGGLSARCPRALLSPSSPVAQHWSEHSRCAPRPAEAFVTGSVHYWEGADH